jgi:hypothetical protein
MSLPRAAVSAVIKMWQHFFIAYATFFGFTYIGFVHGLTPILTPSIRRIEAGFR